MNVIDFDIIQKDVLNGLEGAGIEEGDPVAWEAEKVEMRAQDRENEEYARNWRLSQEFIDEDGRIMIDHSDQ